MSSVGLSEVILQRHSPPQATYQRNRQNQPIDGLFASPGVRVLAAGYYPFDEFFPSDHRGLWMDIDLPKTLGKSRPVKSSFKPRRLVLSNQRVVDRYVALAEAEYRRYNVPGRLAALMFDVESQQGQLTSAQQHQFDRIHADAYTARRLAEKNCRKLHMGGVEWSPQGQEIWDRIVLWSLLIKGSQGCRVSSRKVRRLLKKTGELLAWQLDLAQLQDNLHRDRLRMKAAKTDAKHPQWRRDHITVRAKHAKAYRWCSEQHVAVHNSTARMKMREEGRCRRKARSKGSSGGLRTIQIEQVDSAGVSHLQAVTKRHLVEEGCRRENTARYQQTQTPFPTPPMSEPLYSLFTGPNERQSTLQLLQGTLPIPGGLARPTRAFLHHCRLSLRGALLNQ